MRISDEQDYSWKIFIASKPIHKYTELNKGKNDILTRINFF